MDFRPLQPADLDVVLAAEAVLHPYPWSLGNFADSIDAGHGMWVASESETLLGYAVTTQVLDEVHLLNISILPGHQRAGRGAHFLQHLLDEGRGKGGARKFLEVRPSNTPALGLYQRCGFIQIGRRKGYYPAHTGREDAIVMAREL